VVVKVLTRVDVHVYLYISAAVCCGEM